MMRRLAFLLLPIACACATGSGGEAPSLAGTRWVGVIDAGLDPAMAPRLEFVAGRVQGYTGCNMMSGSWSEQGGEVRFGAIAATKRMCIGPGGDVEKRLLAALHDGSRVAREGERLWVVSPSGARFAFVPAAAA